MRFSKELARRQGGNGYTKGILRVYKCSKDAQRQVVAIMAKRSVKIFFMVE